MIQLVNKQLPQGVSKSLRTYQSEVDKAGSFGDQVAAAKRLFKQRNTARNTTFKEIRRHLDAMCSGVRRCCYCEDSVADEIEHIRPKDWYPEFVFVWENYLYSCGPCNGPKNNRFSIWDSKTGTVIELSQSSVNRPRKPPAGAPLFIDPRAEDPLDFLELDLLGTFFFVPRRGLNARDVQRANYTIELLKLNIRDVLTRARKNAFGTYLARFEQYVLSKESGAQEDELLILQSDFKLVPHPTVWAEMKRQRMQFRKLKDLFHRAPETLSW